MKALSASQEPAAEEFSFQQAAWEQVERWSDICQKFLDWQRRHILSPHNPSAAKLEQHRGGLKWLLRFGRALYLTASDPDYPDKRIRSEEHTSELQSRGHLVC